MSKTIEFVEKEIEYTKNKLGQLEIDLNFPFRKDVITHFKENLQTLEQIKCELEAWEVVKTKIKPVLKLDKEDYQPAYYWWLANEIINLDVLDVPLKH